MNDGKVYLGSAGTQTAGLGFGGLDNPAGPPYRSNQTEEYNGTSWSEQNDLSNRRGQGEEQDCKLQLCFQLEMVASPDYSTYVENYDGDIGQMEQQIV